MLACYGMTIINTSLTVNSGGGSQTGIYQSRAAGKTAQIRYRCLDVFQHPLLSIWLEGLLCWRGGIPNNKWLTNCWMRLWFVSRKSAVVATTTDQIMMSSKILSSQYDLEHCRVLQGKHWDKLSMVCISVVCIILVWIEISHKSGKVYSAAAAGTTKDDGTSTASSTCTINCTDLRNLIRVVSYSSSFLDTFLKLAVRGIKQHCSESSFMVLTFITSEGYSFEMITV